MPCPSFVCRDCFKPGHWHCEANHTPTPSASPLIEPEVPPKRGYFDSISDGSSDSESSEENWGTPKKAPEWHPPSPKAPDRRAKCDLCGMQGHSSPMCLRSAYERVQPSELTLCIRCGEAGHLRCQGPPDPESEFDVFQLDLAQNDEVLA